MGCDLHGRSSWVFLKDLHFRDGKQAWLPFPGSRIILLTPLARIPLSSIPLLPGKKQLARELMIPALVHNSTSKHVVLPVPLFYPVSLDVTCPFTQLCAVPSAMDMGSGSTVIKADFRFSFVLKIFETRRRRSLFDVVLFLEYWWRSRKDGWTGPFWAV